MRGRRGIQFDSAQSLPEEHGLYDGEGVQRLGGDRVVQMVL